MDSENQSRSESQSSQSLAARLHKAARLGQIGEIRKLVSEGVDLNAVYEPRRNRHHPLSVTATPLAAAVGSGDGAGIGTVRVLLELGAAATRLSEGRSALQFACTGFDCRGGGDAKRLRELLRAGCPIPEESHAKNWILTKTARSGDSERLKILLDLGLDPNGYWNSEDAHVACLNQMRRRFKSERSMTDAEADAEIDRTSYLKQQLADSAAGPTESEIPLFCAAESANSECLRMLLAAGADPFRRDRLGRTAMFCVTSKAGLKLLTNAGCKVDERDHEGATPLLAVCSDYSCYAEIQIHTLLKSGADVHARDGQGRTAFLLTNGEGSWRKQMLLVAAGADKYSVALDGQNAFHFAVPDHDGGDFHQESYANLSYLNELGIDINHRDARGRTPLAKAVQSGCEAHARVLCELGADPHVTCPVDTGRHGGSEIEHRPLLFAIDRFHDSDMVRVLLQAGVCPHVRNGEGHTPLQMAICYLCTSASDYSLAYRTCYDGVKQELQKHTANDSREEFLSSAIPALREFLRVFAETLPAPGDSESEWWRRSGQLESVVLLAAYGKGCCPKSPA